MTASSGLVTCLLFSYGGDDLGVSGRQWMVAGVWLVVVWVWVWWWRWWRWRWCWWCGDSSRSSRPLENGTRGGAAARGAALTLLSLVLRVGFWEVFPGHEVHDTCLARGEAQGAQGHVAMQEPPLVDEPEDLCFAHTLVHPLLRPVIEDELRDVSSRLAGAEEEFLGLAAHQDEA